MKKFVQFPHPKDEHGTQSPKIARSNIVYDNENIIRWNNGAHARKFVLNNGSYLKYDGEIGEVIENEKISFWCEWEAQSKYKKLDISNDDLPKFINEVLFWDITERLQNTDPFVFGNNFYWSFCRQNDQVNLRKLDKGSLIIFGSGFGGNFVVDTVFVVKDYVDYKLSSFRSDLRNVDCEPLKEITLESGACGMPPVNEPTYRLYIGANYSDRNEFDGMYSYFPCMPESQLEKNYKSEISKGFERPHIQFINEKGQLIEAKDICEKDKKKQIKKIINPSPNATQSAKTICFNNEKVIPKIWESIREQIRNQKLYEGIYTEIPPKQKAPYHNKLSKPITAYPSINYFSYKDIETVEIEIEFKSDKQCGVLIGNQNRDINPNEYNPVIYVGTNGYLYAKLWDCDIKESSYLKSKHKVNDNKTYKVKYFTDFRKNRQELYLCQKNENFNSFPDVVSSNKVTILPNNVFKDGVLKEEYRKNPPYFQTNNWQLGTGYTRNKPKTDGFWFTFKGVIFSATVNITGNNDSLHYEYPNSDI